MKIGHNDKYEHGKAQCGGIIIGSIKMSNTCGVNPDFFLSFCSKVVTYLNRSHLIS